MTWVKVAASMAAAGFMAAAHADNTVLDEGFDNVAGLGASGWVFTNASAPAGLSWFQGNSGIFPAKAGPADSYAAANFNSTTADAGVVDNWLISPELTLGTGTKLKFYTRAADAGFFDQLEVRFSSGSSSALSSFSTLVGVVGDAAEAAYPVGSWIAFTLSLPDAASGRFALRYSVANAMNASYIGIDSLTVTTVPVPEPTTLVLFGLGLAAVGIAQRRKSTFTLV